VKDVTWTVVEFVGDVDEVSPDTTPLESQSNRAEREAPTTRRRRGGRSKPLAL
jgi:hypothetical protein